MRKYGLQLFHGLVAFAEEDYEKALRILRPQRNEWFKSLSGSRAQLDLLHLILITSAIRFVSHQHNWFTITPLGGKVIICFDSELVSTDAHFEIVLN